MWKADTVGGHGDVVAVDAEVAVVLVESLNSGDVRRSLDHFVDPLDGANHLVALFLQSHNFKDIKSP